VKQSLYIRQICLRYEAYGMAADERAGQPPQIAETFTHVARCSQEMLLVVNLFLTFTRISGIPSPTGNFPTGERYLNLYC